MRSVDVVRYDRNNQAYIFFFFSTRVGMSESV